MTTTSNLMEPPGPKPVLPGANLIALRRNPIQFFQKLARQYGDITYFKIGPQRIYLLNQPDYIKDVLVTHNANFTKGRGLEQAKILLGDGLLTSEGDFHRRQRRLSQPAFHRQRIAGYAETMTGYAQRTRENWQDGATRDMSQEMMALTLAIIGKTMFDADMTGEAAEIRKAISNLAEMFRSFTSPFSALIEKYYPPRKRRFSEAKNRLDSTIYRVIEERRASGQDRGDLLSMLLQAQDTEADGSGMSDLQLRDEALTPFLAGHETTANALTWTWYLLSQNPQVEAKLHAEIDNVLGGRLPTVEALANLKYTEAVLTEAMRLFPPAWIVGRRTINDYQLAGYTIPAGSIIMMSQFVMHHNPRYFPEPDRFDPDRWTAEMRANLPKYAYFPFGGGPRICIGEPFAWMEGRLLLATLAQNWQFRFTGEHKPELRPGVTLRPKNGMPMRLERRKIEQANPGQKNSTSTNYLAQSR